MKEGMVLRTVVKGKLVELDVKTIHENAKRRIGGVPWDTRVDWSDIDEGIKPLVEVLRRKGYKTYASCEGHPDPRRKGWWLNAYVSFLSDDGGVATLQKLLSDLIKTKQIEIVKHIHDKVRIDEHTLTILPQNREKTNRLVTEITDRLHRCEK